MAISLQKRTEAAETSLVKLLKREADKGVDLGELTAQVILAVDYSGSMQTRYQNGEVQTTVERALALSLSGLDDDGKVQVFFFDHDVYAAEEVTASVADRFVARWTSGRSMGGTNYTPVIKAILDFTSSNGMLAAGQPPVLVIFVTDGEPGDKRHTTDLLKDAAKLPIFWQFLGLGYSPRFLEKLDTMGGRVVDNVGLTEMANTLHMDDGEFYDEVIREFFGAWLPDARRHNITR